MARLIEDKNLIEYIKSEELARRVIRSKDSIRDILIEVINEQPTVDAVEVVRCENCKFCISEIYKDPTLGYCEICDRVTDNDDFCSTGIKMDGGDKA